MLVVGLVVVLAGGGTTAWWFTAGEDDEVAKLPKPALTGQVAWKLPEPSPQAETRVVGSWSAADAVVRVTKRGITAWSESSGEKKWGIAPPTQSSGDGVFCGVSSNAVKGFGAVSYGTDDECTDIMLVNLKNGQSRWDVSIPLSGGEISVDKAHLDIAGKQVVYAHDRAVSALGFEDGEKSWTYRKKDCQMRSHAAEGETVVLERLCGSSERTMVVLDSATGQVEGKAPLPGESLVSVVSADPVVLSVKNIGSSDGGKYLVFDEQGDKKTSISHQSVPAGLETSRVNSVFAAHEQYQVIFSNGMLVTMTERLDSNYSSKIVAFDLDTGKLRWSKSFGSDVRGVPFAATKGGVLAINSGYRDKSSKVVQLSWKDGTATPVSEPYSSLGVVFVQDCTLYREGDAVYAVNMSDNEVAPKAFALK